MQTKLMISVLALSLGMLGGCADTTKIDAIKATADAAMAKATDAYNLAQNAHNVASEASYNATQALASTQTALECCNETKSRLDKMFEKAMKK